MIEQEEYTFRIGLITITSVQCEHALFNIQVQMYTMLEPFFSIEYIYTNARPLNP